MGFSAQVVPICLSLRVRCYRRFLPILDLSLRWFLRQMLCRIRCCCTGSRILPFTSFYVGVKVNAVGVRVNVAALWLWGVKVNMGG